MFQKNRPLCQFPDLGVWESLAGRVWDPVALIRAIPFSRPQDRLSRTHVVVNNAPWCLAEAMNGSRLTCHVWPFAEARAEIAGPAEKFVRPGSTLQLHCLVKKSTEVPSYLFWYHNFRMINYDVDQGVNVSTDLASRESWLEVPRASDRHSGNYTCEASNAQPARVLVHVFKGDNPAAMQHSMASSPSVMACTALFTMFITLKLALQTNWILWRA